MLTFSHKANIWHFWSNVTHWNANWYIYCNHRIPCINFTQEKNRNWSNYVTHQNCCERKAIPSKFLNKSPNSCSVPVTLWWMFQWRIDSVRTLNSIHRLNERDLEHKIHAVCIIRREWRHQQWPAGAKETILRQSQGSLAQFTLSIGYDMAVKDILSKIIDTKKKPPWKLIAYPV